MSEYRYNPWPLGKLPKEFQRPELDQLKQAGYRFEDAREVVDLFEKKVAKFAGSNYAVAVDCCTHAIELAFRYLMIIGELSKGDTINMPAFTYISAAIVPIRMQLRVTFHEYPWSGLYQYEGSRVIDSAVRWTRDMYIKNSLQCISFQMKKRVPIGKGGIILCDHKQEYEWLKLASYDGRNLKTPYDSPDHLRFNGWHYYMTPEDAARGILLMDQIPQVNEDTGNNTMYPDVRKMMENWR